MAYAALITLEQTLEKILKHDQYSTIFYPERKAIESLHEKVIFLQEFLEEFPEKSRNLEGRITDTANEAQDIIESEQNGAITCPENMDYLGMFISLFQSGVFVEKLHQYLQKPRKEIDCIVEEVIKIKESGKKDQDESSIRSFGDSSSRVAPSSGDTMVGFDDDLLEIKDRLCGASHNLWIIPIVGMGGMGKTTLAKNAYEDQLIVQRFDVRAWVTVSQNYREREILESLLRSMGAPMEKIREEIDKVLQQKGTPVLKIREEIDRVYQQKVYQTLKGRRYLIVMDDMWSTNVWDDFKRLFPDDYNGSRIMVTTRLLDVALYAGEFSSLYKLSFMDDDRSWSLLREKVFGQEDCPLELEEIGKMIAKNCQGLPLAIVVIGGVLSKVNQTRYVWKEIAENVRRAVNTSDMPFMSILSLSYDHLPHRLKPCFLYLGSFPEDTEVRASNLIHLWVAEGFLKPSRFKSLEEVAEDYLEDLVKRNLVLVIQKRSNSKINTVKIHDLLRDLCLQKSWEGKFFHHVVDNNTHNFPQSINNLRRLSVFSDTPCHFSNINDSSIRTILFFKQNLELLCSISFFMLLKVLDARIDNFTGFLIEQVPPYHLRYLALSFSGSHRQHHYLPASISKFQNLQTLIASLDKNTSNDTLNLQTLILGKNTSGYTLNLPLEVWRMKELRHLLLFKKSLFPDPADDVLPLENLQTLWHAANLAFTKRILEMIPNVKKLGLYYEVLKFEQGWSEYELNNLVYLHKLEELKLSLDSFRRNQHPLSKKFISFPQNLRKLTLVKCSLPWKDMTIVGSLPHLENLILKKHACVGDVWETSEGEFCKLKVLQIYLAELSLWIVESTTHFPVLEQIVLHACCKLEEIPPAVGEIPTLQLIELDDESKSLMESAKLIQAEQQDFGNDVLQVLVVKSKYHSSLQK